MRTVAEGKHQNIRTADKVIGSVRNKHHLVYHSMSGDGEAPSERCCPANRVSEEEGHSDDVLRDAGEFCHVLNKASDTDDPRRWRRKSLSTVSGRLYSEHARQGGLS